MALIDTIRAADRRGPRNRGFLTESDVEAISRALGEAELAGRLRAITEDDLAGLLSDTAGPGALRFLAGVVQALIRRVEALEQRLPPAPEQQSEPRP